jgi:hypothetical protein
MKKRIYRDALSQIANAYVELSLEKAMCQRDEFIRIARAALEQEKPKKKKPVKKAKLNDDF